MLFEEDDIRRQRGALSRGEYVDPDPLPEGLEIPDGLLLVSDRQRMAETYAGLLRAHDFGEPEQEAELLMRTANLIIGDEGEEPLICPWRSLDLFTVMNFVLVLLLRGVDVDDRARFFEFLDVFPMFLSPLVYTIKLADERLVCWHFFTARVWYYPTRVVF